MVRTSRQKCAPRLQTGGATSSRCSVSAEKIHRGAGVDYSFTRNSRSPRLQQGHQIIVTSCTKRSHAAVAPGLIAYVGDHPVGWTRVGARSAFPGIRGNRALARVLAGDDAGTWWVTCFVVDSRHRRSGIGSALLQAAVEFARDHGATTVEGHPVDVAALKSDRVSGSAIYTGTVAMFAAAGFVEVARTYPTRPVMRLSI